MDDDDDSLKELEIRLYQQIHYSCELNDNVDSAVTSAKEEQQHVVADSLEPVQGLVSKVPMNRYWVLGSRSLNNQNNISAVTSAAPSKNSLSPASAVPTKTPTHIALQTTQIQCNTKNSSKQKPKPNTEHNQSQMQQESNASKYIVAAAKSKPNTERNQSQMQQESNACEDIVAAAKSKPNTERNQSQMQQESNASKDIVAAAKSKPNTERNQSQMQQESNASKDIVAAAKSKPSTECNQSQMQQESNEHKNPFAGVATQKFNTGQTRYQKQPQSKVLNPIAAAAKMRKQKKSFREIMENMQILNGSVNRIGKRKLRRLRSQMQTINLLSDDSENDDVVLLPAPSPTIIAIDTSEDDEIEDDAAAAARRESEKQAALKIDENAMDATFARPQMSTNIGGLEKRSGIGLESRCTSPCSVQSADDFIGVTDRRRLNAAATATTLALADDDNSVQLKSTTTASQLVVAAKTATERSQTVREAPPATGAVSSFDVEFIAPQSVPKVSKAAGSVNSNPYRVDQSAFRAHDVYESESDMTDSDHARVGPRSTIIRSIDSSSDESNNDVTVYVGNSGGTTKRFRKHRTSSRRNSKSDATVIAISSSSDEEKAAASFGNGTTPTPVPFIMHGQALERRRDSVSGATLRRRRHVSESAAGHMSDSEFIAQLNTLVQGGKRNVAADMIDDNEDDDEVAEAPTARDMVAKVLKTDGSIAALLKPRAAVPKPRAAVLKPEEVVYEAVPKHMMDGLQDVFALINQKNPVQRSTANDDCISSDSTSDEAAESEIVPFPTVDEEVPTTSAAAAAAAIAAAAVIAAAAAAAASTAATVPPNDTTERPIGDPVYNVVYSAEKYLNRGIGWNDEMFRFYNDSWNGENFRMRDVWRRMNPSKDLWRTRAVDNSARGLADNNGQSQNSRKSRVKCYNCRELGHSRRHCQRPLLPAVCYMCGERGHKEPRCPNTVCLRCGQKTHAFTKGCKACMHLNRMICKLCRVRGHSAQLCPDLWRRYHSTTEPNVQPERFKIRHKTSQNCCVCGKRGHLAEHCKQPGNGVEYPIAVSSIQSYAKAYKDEQVQVIASKPGIAYNLMYSPRKEYKFKMAENTTRQKYYGRFLSTVGMTDLLKRKRRATSEDNDSPCLLQPKRVAVSQIRKCKPEDSVQVPAPKFESLKTDPELEVSKTGLKNDEKTAEPMTGASHGVTGAAEDVIFVEEASRLTSTPKRETAVAKGELGEQFKTPNRASNKETPVSVVHVDSDSNYSFSEHFEISPATTDAAVAASDTMPSAAVATACVAVSPNAKSRPMATLPEFISINSDDDDKNEIVQKTGISSRYHNDTDGSIDDEVESVSAAPIEVPCEAKICVTDFYARYLQSSLGNTFLTDISTSCNIKARLDTTDLGYVVRVFGMPAQQDQFQGKVMDKYREINKLKMEEQCDNVPKVPKQADVLIRFLRCELQQLLSNLGNPNDALKRVQSIEQCGNGSRKSCRNLAKARRALNMILLGQAGLINGDRHVDQLFSHIKTLLVKYKPTAIIASRHRTEINHDWKMIFTSYPHGNYPSLLEDYHRLPTKNRLLTLNLDPGLLFGKFLDTTLTAEQKNRLEQPPQNQPKPPEVITSPAASGDMRLNSLASSNTKLVSRKELPDVLANSPMSPVKLPLGSPKVQSSPTARLNKSPMETKTNIGVKRPATSPINARDSAGTMSSVADEQSPPPATPPVSVESLTAPVPPPPPSILLSPLTTSALKKQKTALPSNLDDAQKSTTAAPMKLSSDSVIADFEDVATELLDDDGDRTKHAYGSGNVIDTSNITKPTDIAKTPSMFWSREAKNYLDECLRETPVGDKLYEKVKIVHMQSRNGQLSYNDYITIKKLRAALLG